jgi:hypothetical protein
MIVQTKHLHNATKASVGPWQEPIDRWTRNYFGEFTSRNKSQKQTNPINLTCIYLFSKSRFLTVKQTSSCSAEKKIDPITTRS